MASGFWSEYSSIERANSGGNASGSSIPVGIDSSRVTLDDAQRILGYKPASYPTNRRDFNLWLQRRSRKSNAVAKTVQEEQITTAAAGTPIRILYGRREVGPQLLWFGTYQNDLVLQLAWCLGEVEAIEAVKIGGKEVPAGVTLTHYLGAATQAVDPVLAAAIPGYADDMVIAFAGETVGVCYTVARIDKGAVQGFPLFTAIVRGRKVYDPRDSTQKYSTNPSLCLADFETSALYGRGRAVDWESVKTAANANDELVGANKRRTMSLSLERRADVDTYMEALAKYAGVFVSQRGDATYLVPDRPKAAGRALTASDIQNLRLSKPSISQKPTVITVTYTDTSAAKWRDAPIIVKADGVDLGTTPWREQALRMPGITSHEEAYRFAVEQYNALNIVNLEGEFVTRDEGLLDEIGDVVTITHPRGLTAEPVQITGHQQLGPGRWRIQFVEYDEDRFSNDIVSGPNFDDTDLPSPLDVPQVMNVAATEELYQLNTGDYSSRLRLTWDALDYPYRFEYTWRVYQGGTLLWQGQTVTEEGVTGSVVGNTTYTCKVTARSQTGVLGPESTEFSVTALGKFIVPTDVPQIAAQQISANSVKLSWLPSIDVDTLRYEIRQGDTWDSATVLDVVDGLERIITELKLGSYRFLVKPIDSVHQYSDNPAIVNITLNGPTAPATLIGFEAGGEVRLSWPAGSGYLSGYEVRYGAVGFAWASGRTIDVISALRLFTKDIPAGTWEFAIRAVDAAGNASSDEARCTLTVTLDNNAFLADNYTFTTATWTNVESWSHRPENNVTTTYVTNMGDTAASLWSSVMSTYTQPLATYHSSASSEWLSESHDFGQQLSGTWIAEHNATALSGTITVALEVSADNFTWTQHASLTAKATARYARVRISATTTSTLNVTTPGVLARISVIPREETHTVSIQPGLWSLSFDGVNDTMPVTGLSIAGDVTHTVEAWVYLLSYPAARSNIITLYPNVPGGEHWLLNSSGRISTGRWGGPQGGLTGILPLNTWRHIATVYDKSVGTYTTLVNGVVASTYTVSITPFALDGGFKLGFNSTGEQWGNFKIHQLRIWNTARTTQQIQDNMWLELAGSEAGLVGLWPCNDGSGTTVSDLTSGGHHGMLNGGVTWSPRGTTVLLDNTYAATQSIVLSPTGSLARTYAVDNIAMGEPSFFEAYLFDPSTGSRVSGSALVTFKGI